MGNSVASDAVLNWRIRAKLRFIEAFGGGCGICGYSRCARNLAFHHLDPSQKDKEFGDYHCKSWARMVVEIRKCVMLCHNCHGEYHDGLITDLSSCPRFNEEYAVYFRVKQNGKFVAVYKKPEKFCEICHKSMNLLLKRWCSIECSRISRSAFKGTPDGLRQMFDKMTLKEIAVELGIAQQSAGRLGRKFGIPKKTAKTIRTGRRLGLAAAF